MQVVKGKIGLGITTRNRNKIASICLAKWKEFSSEFKIVVIDDNSDIPFKDADYRFEERTGVSSAKNKCLALLDDCEYIFLSDDDFWPIRNNWHLAYTQSGLNHACYTFKRKPLWQSGTYTSFEKPCGCFLFATHKVLETVGGFDTEFEGYGYDHVNWSDRIYNAGLTPERYIDVIHTYKMFNSLDENKEIESTFSYQERAKSIPSNFKLYQEKYHSKEFKPYK